MEFVISVLVGVVGSVIATAMIFGGTFVYKIGWHKESIFYARISHSLIDEIINHLGFPEDYAFVISHTHELRKNLAKIVFPIRSLSMICDKKRKQLITTLVFNMLHICDEMLNFTRGESDKENEIASRMNRIKKMVYGCSRDEETGSSKSILFLNIKVIDLLLNKQSWSDVCLELEKSWKRRTEQNKISFEQFLTQVFIGCNSFSDSGATIPIAGVLAKNGITKTKFMEIMRGTIPSHVELLDKSVVEARRNGC